MRYSKSQFARCGVEKNLGFLYNQNMAKRCGFPPIYKIERVAKMSAKRVFFGVLQKIMVICCAMFFGFTNAFSANLPSGYTELEYIESSGTQYIDTGYTPNQDTSVMLDAQCINYNSGTQGILFGARTSATENVFVIQRLTAGNWNMGYNAASIIVGTADTNRHMFYKDKQYQYLDGVLKGTGTYSSFTCPGTAILFGFNNAGTPKPTSFPAKIYSFKMWNNRTLVRNFIPAKNSSGVVGLYDTVGNRFYTNQGTGEFTGGPVVCPNGELAQTYTSATGTVTQSGTPTPTNPIEPTFYQQGNMVLRALKSIQGDIIYTDSYDATTGKITRRVGTRILDGTENWEITTASVAENYYFYLSFNIPLPEGFSSGAISTHFPTTSVAIANNNQGIIVGRRGATGYQGIYLRWNDLYVANSTTINSFKQWLAQQYAAGTPVVVYYPLATPVEETVETTYCAPGIKIATTAYNTAQFNPVVTDLNSTIATIRDIVTKTINQTVAIASLQADKQTRPEDACPAGKKCLLVETEENGVIVPHWFPIIEAPEE